MAPGMAAMVAREIKNKELKQEKQGKQEKDLDEIQRISKATFKVMFMWTKIFFDVSCLLV